MPINYDAPRSSSTLDVVIDSNELIKEDLVTRALKKLDIEERKLEQEYMDTQEEMLRKFGDCNIFDDDEDEANEKAGLIRDIVNETSISNGFLSLILDQTERIRSLILTHRYQQQERLNELNGITSSSLDSTSDVTPVQKPFSMKDLTISTLTQLITDKSNRILTHIGNLNYEIEGLRLDPNTQRRNLRENLRQYQAKVRTIEKRRSRILDGDMIQVQEELNIIHYLKESSEEDEHDDQSPPDTYRVTVYEDGEENDEDDE